MKKKALIKRLHEIGVIMNKPVLLRSSITADFYCDIKKAYGYPDILNALANLVIAKLKKSENCIAVSGYGGLPLGAVGATVGAVLAGAPQLVGGVITDANVVQVLHEIGLVLIALFGMLGSFGIGRKAGAGS